MRENEVQELINSQLLMVKEAILIILLVEIIQKFILNSKVEFKILDK